MTDSRFVKQKGNFFQGRIQEGAFDLHQNVRAVERILRQEMKPLDRDLLETGMLGSEGEEQVVEAAVIAF